jgi:selenocysteine lyase/cysteine desulfurase
VAYIGSSNVAMLWGLRASIEFANRLGMARIEKRLNRLDGVTATVNFAAVD